MKFDLYTKVRIFWDHAVVFERFFYTKFSNCNPYNLSLHINYRTAAISRLERGINLNLIRVISHSGQRTDNPFCNFHCVANIASEWIPGNKNFL